MPPYRLFVVGCCGLGVGAPLRLPPSEQSFQPQDSQTGPEVSRAMFYWGKSEWSSCDLLPVSASVPTVMTFWVRHSGRTFYK